jgi:type VI secretion system secreted protein Hcp
MNYSLPFLCALLLWAAPVRAVDMYLKLTGIPGESVAIQHKDEILIESYSMGMSMPLTTGSTGGTTTGKAVFDEVQFTKRTDRSTPALMLSCANGTHIAEAVLSLRKPGAESFLFMRVTLSDVIVTRFLNAASASDTTPMESFSLNFRKIKVEHIRQNPDGSTAISTFAWDLALNRSF